MSNPKIFSHLMSFSSFRASISVLFSSCLNNSAYYFVRYCTLLRVPRPCHPVTVPYCVLPPQKDRLIGPDSSSSEEYQAFCSLMSDGSIFACSELGAGWAPNVSL